MDNERVNVAEFRKGYSYRFFRAGGGNGFQRDCDASG
jgi:hypothetical protein